MPTTIQDTLKKLEKAVRGLESVAPAKKKELLGMIAPLKAEADRLSSAGRAAKRLAQSVQTFEGSHPKLVESLDEICRLLGSLGI